jgi:hypothetical protein
MRHDGCGGRAGRVELIFDIESASPRPVHKIVLITNPMLQAHGYHAAGRVGDVASYTMTAPDCVGRVGSTTVRDAFYCQTFQVTVLVACSAGSTKGDYGVDVSRRRSSQ